MRFHAYGAYRYTLMINPIFAELISFYVSKWYSCFMVTQRLYFICRDDDSERNSILGKKEVSHLPDGTFIFCFNVNGNIVMLSVA